MRGVSLVKNALEGYKCIVVVWLRVFMLGVVRIFIFEIRFKGV